MPSNGLEPSRKKLHSILSAECLPFHHKGWAINCFQKVPLFEITFLNKGRYVFIFLYGKGGIRTHGSMTSSVFKTEPLNRSGTFPYTFSERSKTNDLLAFLMQPPVGFEPTTLALQMQCSSPWAKEASLPKH